MSLVVALSPVDDVRMFPLPREWEELDGSVQEGLVWWALVKALLDERAIGFVNPASPLRDVEIVIASNPDDVHAVRLRHTCPKCRREQTDLLRRLADGEVGAVAVCQFSYTELTDLATAARKSQTEDPAPSTETAVEPVAIVNA